jgi:hypothetical protein
MTPILAPALGVTFGVTFKGRFSLKNGTYCPLLATIQRLSSARVFLSEIRSKGCFYGLHLHCCAPVHTYLMKRTVEFQLGIESTRQVEVQNVTRPENIQYKY